MMRARRAWLLVLQVVIQVIENQALIWLGAMYAPLLPAFGLIANIIAFYFKLLLAVWLHSPPTTRYSASRTSNLAYGLMLCKPSQKSLSPWQNLLLKKHQFCLQNLWSWI